MKRVLLFGIAGSAAVLALRAARRMARTTMPKLMDHMMEERMPGMMDACFGQMTPDRRRFMLEHCRNMLDQVEARYATSSATLL